jgi:hypothetical protein
LEEPSVQRPAAICCALSAPVSSLFRNVPVPTSIVSPFWPSKTARSFFLAAAGCRDSCFCVSFQSAIAAAGICFAFATATVLLTSQAAQSPLYDNPTVEELARGAVFMPAGKRCAVTRR